MNNSGMSDCRCGSELNEQMKVHCRLCALVNNQPLPVSPVRDALVIFVEVQARKVGVTTVSQLSLGLR